MQSRNKIDISFLFYFWEIVMVVKLNSLVHNGSFWNCFGSFVFVTSIDLCGVSAHHFLHLQKLLPWNFLSKGHYFLPILVFGWWNCDQSFHTFLVAQVVVNSTNLIKFSSIVILTEFTFLRGFLWSILFVLAFYSLCHCRDYNIRSG